MNLHERVARGRMAKALIETHGGALLGIDTEIAREMLATDPGDTEKRDMVYHEYHGFKRMIAKLKLWVQDGELAEAAIAEQEREQR